MCFLTYILFLKRHYQLINDGGVLFTVDLKYCISEYRILVFRAVSNPFPLGYDVGMVTTVSRCVACSIWRHIEMTLNVYIAVRPAATRKKKISELRRLKLIYLWLRIWKEAVITHFKHTVSYFAWREGGKNWRPQSVFPSVTWISNRVLSEYNLQSCAASVMLSVLRNCVKRLRFSLRMCRMRLLLLWALTARKSLLLGPTHDA